MRILIAPDKFKGCLAAQEVAAAMQRGALAAQPSAQIDLCPMADGGEGTVAALVNATGGRFETRRVTGPLPEMKVNARFGLLGDGKTAVIEMAAASGLALLPPADRDPMRTTTFGTGQLLMAAASLGVSRIILGIGGSATIDAGIGAAQACGLPVILENGEPLAMTEPLTGADVARVVLIKHGRGSPIEKVQILVACDVTNPLAGPTGAAAIFGPQKGATADQIQTLDAALLQLARRNDKLNVADQPGAGAAGGLGFGMAAFFGATLQSGIELVMEATKLRERLSKCDLCLTGEGRLDAQSAHGKTIAGVARAARIAGVPCIAICGSVEGNVNPLSNQGLTTAIPILIPPMTLEYAIQNAAQLIESAASAAVSSFNSTTPSRPPLPAGDRT